MKFLVFLLYSLSLFGPNLDEIRKNYPLANENQEAALKMYTAISGITDNDKPILIAYKGGLSTILAKHSNSIKDKKRFFKEGVALLELAVEKDNDNIEIRCIRLGVQENSPRFLKYKDAIESDKQFILDNFSSETSPEIQAFVRGYVQLSEAFSDSEKQLF